MTDSTETVHQSSYYETMLYGIIDGLTADFDANCASSLFGVVNGGFRAKEYKNIADPRNTVKFQMAITQFTESTNSVYAYCDFTHLYNQVAMLTDYTAYDQYIQLLSRIGGSMI